MAERTVHGQNDQAAAATATSGKLRDGGPAIIEAHEIDKIEHSSPAPLLENADYLAATEVAEPIYANLIQFPREVVATRKLRPRRIEGPLATAAPGVQLSIFEVDPGSMAAQPALAAAEEPLAPAWMREEWAGIQVEEHPQETLAEEPEPLAVRESAIQLASLSRRLLALVMDATLVTGAALALISPVLRYAKVLPSLHTLELITVIALLLLGAAYQSLFLIFASATPGMWYAGMALRTLEEQIPSRRQRCARLLALPLSILPLGLGLAWSLFDENHLTWHDRLSGTYLRTR